MKLIDADKLIEKLGDKQEFKSNSNRQVELLHNYGVEIRNRFHDKVTKIVDELSIDLSKVIDEEKVKEIIGDVDYDCFGSKLTHGKLHTLMANAIVKNINKCLK